MYCNPETLGVVKTPAKPQFASTQLFFRRGNGSMRKRAVQLEGLI
jgi:hypothetical protein